LVKIGPVVLERKSKMQVYRQTDDGQPLIRRAKYQLLRTFGATAYNAYTSEKTEHLGYFA
jgi:hypothetical protein